MSNTLKNDPDKVMHDLAEMITGALGKTGTEFFEATKEVYDKAEELRAEAADFQPPPPVIGPTVPVAGLGGKPKPKPILEQFAEIDERLTVLKAELAALDALKTKLMPAVLEWMSEAGSTSMRVDKLNRTVYVSREIWANKAEGLTAADFGKAMRALGNDEFEAIGTQRLSAWVREELGDHKEPGFDEKGEPIPFEDHLAKYLPKEVLVLIKVTSQMKVRSRKVAKS